MSTEDGARRARSRSPFDARGLARLVRRAGALALEHRPEPNGRVPSASSVIAEIESWLSREARASHPRVRVAPSQETGPLPNAEWVLTVHAIDGVDAYLAGLPTWSIVLGLLRRGRPWSAAVAAPALGDLYVASSGTLRWQGQPLAPLEGAPSPFVLGTGLEKRSILRLRRRREADGPNSYHVCLVARGAAEGAVLGRVGLRELAPLACILEPVGGELVSLRTGQPLDLDSLRGGRASRDPVLAATAGRAAALVARLKK